MKIITILSIFLICSGCGSEEVSFVGTWSGNLSLLQNGCPFNAPLNQDQVFPIVVTQSASNELTVVAANGSSGNGIENDQNESFLVADAPFGERIANTAPLAECTITNTFGLFTVKDATAESQLNLNYSNCTNTSGAAITRCTVSYAGDASKIN